jgi:hypothetical protein
MGTGPPPAPRLAGAVRSQVELVLARDQALARGGLQDLQLVSSWADPMCSISRDPRREECTTCIAVAPDAVFSVRTYGDTGQLYGPY